MIKSTKKLWDDCCFDRYVLCVLIAAELLMSFTFLGYIHLPPISVTIAYIPILVAGSLFSPLQSAAVGAVFGIASMYKASASYVFPADAVFSPFLSEAPLNSILLSIGTRALFGFLIGAAYLSVRQAKYHRLWRGVISMIAPKIHSLIVYSAMGILFPRLGYHYSSALQWDWGDAVFAAICVMAVELLWILYQSNVMQNIKMCIDQSVHSPYTSEKMNLFFAAFELFMLCMAVCAAVYFSERASFMLERHGIAVTNNIASDLLFLQIQFLIALFSLNIISVILLVSIYKYMAYKEYRGELDELTGIMGRRMFFYHCDKIQKANTADLKKRGWFLFVDADYFKEINDTFGHSVGDKVLREIAVNLQKTFGEDGKVGRIGGDEFAVMIENPLPRQDLERRLDQFLQCISGTLPDKKISCSIGAYEFVFPQNMNHILTETDHMLYKAKGNGRACFAVKSCTLSGADS